MDDGFVFAEDDTCTVADAPTPHARDDHPSDRTPARHAKLKRFAAMAAAALGGALLTVSLVRTQHQARLWRRHERRRRMRHLTFAWAHPARLIAPAT